MSQWWDSYRGLFRWNLLRQRAVLPLLISIQVVLAIGVVYGLSLLVPHIDPTTAIYLATGAPTLGLILLGLNIVPQEVSQARLTGRHDYVVSLPVPRLAPLVAEVSFWLVVQIPGTLLALGAAALKFDISFSVGWTVVPAIGLVALTGAAVGYAIASSLPPQVTNHVTQFVAIALLLFSPVDFPADRMPGFLQAIHRVLPVQYMADLVRGSLTGHYADSRGLAFAVVGAWCAAALAVSYRAAVRRR